MNNSTHESMNGKRLGWTGIHYYHPPRYANRLLVIGIFGKLFYWEISNPEDKTRFINNA